MAKTPSNNEDVHNNTLQTQAFPIWHNHIFRPGAFVGWRLCYNTKDTTMQFSQILITQKTKNLSQSLKKLFTCTSVLSKASPYLHRHTVSDSTVMLRPAVELGTAYHTFHRVTYMISHLLRNSAKIPTLLALCLLGSARTIRLHSNCWTAGLTLRLVDVKWATCQTIWSTDILQLVHMCLSTWVQHGVHFTAI